MKGTSKVIMGATLVMVVSLAIVLGLVLVLLVELYCSLLLRRRRQLRNTPTTTTNTSSRPTQTQEQSASPLSSFYAQGVLDAPRNFLFPAVSSKQYKAEKNNQTFQLHSVLDIHTQDSNTSPHCLGIISPTSPSTSFITSPPTIQETTTQVVSNTACTDKDCGGGGGIGGEHFVYISNPIYDNDASRLSREDTPFETPDTSPSRLETGGSSSEEEISQPSPSSQHSLPNTPPLTPMKKLPAEACSVSLRDAGSLGTSGSDSISNNGLSSSSSGSPCTSPSW
ncbi:putative Transmembrane protein [Melia azedarach]|uniref:Transmembrane protein n=1 Tax=Melia azedarach TaxID=155640 RepID=A0ACC1XB76_MELAZ|nr:putative Transmembrane protein [Melia azedarach]